jgi:hypothetical protein
MGMAPLSDAAVVGLAVAATLAVLLVAMAIGRSRGGRPCPPCPSGGGGRCPGGAWPAGAGDFCTPDSDCRTAGYECTGLYSHDQVAAGCCNPKAFGENPSLYCRAQRWVLPGP